MQFIEKNWKGMLLCLVISTPCWFLGKMFPLIGGPVFAIIAGMIVTLFIHDKTNLQTGINYVSKKILQYAVILLGFVIKADDEEVAQSISVIFFFNMVAALVFPTLGMLVGFSTGSGEAFGIFAGTAVNDTSSVTACAATWDSMHNLGSATLDKAVTVKLTRTLAIIPITMVLAYLTTKNAKNAAGAEGNSYSIKSVFPFFIIYFVLASVITTIALNMGVAIEAFNPLKTLSKFFIVLSMCAIGLNTNIVKLIKTGGKPLFMGFCCWVGITVVSLVMQHVLGLW